MCDTIERYMREAIKLAAESASSGGGPFGCVIVKDGEIVAESSNSVTKDNDPTAHAEVNAIRKACAALGTFSLEGCELYASCEPCPMCLAACYWAHIDKVYYAGDQNDAAEVGFDDRFIYKEFDLQKDKRSLPVVPLLAQEGKIPFEVWAKNEKKIHY